jgi:thiosulfate/3-mercaptopyruvate sulfurtransferase
MLDLPLLIEAETVEPILGSTGLKIIDLTKAQVYHQLHIPGAIHLEYSLLVKDKKPVGGLLPDIDYLTTLFSNLGINNSDWVIAYDDEGGGKASRLMWTLDCLGFHRHSLLNGGIHNWMAEQRPVSQDVIKPDSAIFVTSRNDTAIADAEYIIDKLNDENVILLDTRSIEEYTGQRRFAQRGGHIPGAIHFDWVNGFNQNDNMRLYPLDILQEKLAALNIHKEQEIICYCQTHHRSSFTYVMLKILGYANVRGYHGAWSDWGNRNDTPIET